MNISGRLSGTKRRKKIKQGKIIYINDRLQGVIYGNTD